MRLHLLATAAVLMTTGCGGLYEDVPVYGESNPNTFVSDRQPQGSVEAIQQVQVNANQATQAIDPGQDVNASQPADTYSDTDPSALSDFKATLDPYGQWADDGTYGTVWQPDAGVVGADFQPYVSAGHWSYDNADYVWNSDYDWGWAPFHYGRWAWIAGRGWCWIPGRTYAGAWVSWRVGAPGYGYVGWGPLAPTWGWRGGAAYNYGFNAHTPYTFCGTGDLFSPSLHDHVVRGGGVTVIGGNTQPWNGRTPAHPGVGGPTPSRLGVAPPMIQSHVPGSVGPGLARALAYSRPTTAAQFGARAPSSPSAIAHATQVPYSQYQNHGVVSDRPVAIGPRYSGVAPQPYHSYAGATGHYSPQSTTIGRSYGPSYGSSYGGYHGGSFGGGSYGGGSFHAPSSSSYSHPSYSHGSGGGSHGGGHGGGHR